MILNCFKMTVVQRNLVLLPFKVMNTPKSSSIPKITYVIYFFFGGGVRGFQGGIGSFKVSFGVLRYPCHKTDRKFVMRSLVNCIQSYDNLMIILQ
jgi:hypothetical protein